MATFLTTARSVAEAWRALVGESRDHRLQIYTWCYFNQGDWIQHLTSPEFDKAKLGLQQPRIAKTMVKQGKFRHQSLSICHFLDEWPLLFVFLCGHGTTEVLRPWAHVMFSPFQALWSLGAVWSDPAVLRPACYGKIILILHEERREPIIKLFAGTIASARFPSLLYAKLLCKPGGRERHS